MSSVIINGQEKRLNPNMIIGRGGEAVIYDIGKGQVLKLYKRPNDPDFADLPNEQMGAVRRLENCQKKLPLFPRNMPAHVIKPIDLAYDTNRTIAGFTMEKLTGGELLVRYSDLSFRRLITDENLITGIFLDLHDMVRVIHGEKVVIGDFNDLNVLVKDQVVNIFDADSMQYAGFMCNTYTDKFVDPRIIRRTTPQEEKENLNIGSFVMYKPHDEMTDWYAFSVLLMQSLLCVGPYGGILATKTGVKPIRNSERPLNRLTIFDDSQVRFPKAGYHFRLLPEELVELWKRMFSKEDYRIEFPKRILEEMRWTTCLKCGTRHASHVCPECKYATPMVRLTIEIHGTVTRESVFHINSGNILSVAFQNGKLNWLYHENDQFKRENGQTILKGPINLGMRFRMSGKKTLIAANNAKLVIFDQDGKILGTPKEVDIYSNSSLPVFGANEKNFFWTSQGQLWKDKGDDGQYLGDVFNEQTLFWVGDKFGFGFYRAGEMTVGFIFGFEEKSVKEVAIPKIKGQLIDSSCTFSQDKCWFFVSTQEKGKTINRCVLINSNGVIDGQAEAEAGDDSWLGTVRGKSASGKYLFVPTDDGIVRMEMVNGTAIITRFPDTEPFVDSQSFLYVGNGGIYVQDNRKINFLKIKQ